MAPPGNPVVGSSFLAQLHSLRETMAKVALSSEETSLLCAEALRLADDLQQRPSAMPPGFDDGSAFRALQGTDELRLVTDLVSAADAICLMLTCRKLRDAVFARFPRTIGGRIPFESECKYVECEEVACKNARMREAEIRTLLCPPRLEDRFEVLSGHVASVARLRWAEGTLGLARSGFEVCRAAAGLGRIDVLREARRLEFPWDSNACAAAAGGGHLACLEYMRTLLPATSRCPWDEGTCAAAAAGGHVDILRWARQRRCKWDESTTSRAAYSGQLAALQWARKNSCPWDASDVLCEALYGGHVDVFKWAVINGGDEVESEDFDWTDVCEAVANKGLLEVLEWLLGRDQGDVDVHKHGIMEAAAHGGQVAVCKWGLARWSDGPPSADDNEDMIDSQDVIAGAARFGHIEILELMLSRGDDCGECTMWAARCSQLEVLKWAHAKGLPWSSDVCKDLATEGSLEALQFVRSVGCPWGSNPLERCEDDTVSKWALDNGAPPQTCESDSDEEEYYDESEGEEDPAFDGWY